MSFTEAPAAPPGPPPPDVPAAEPASPRPRLAWLKADWWLKKARPEEPPAAVETPVGTGDESPVEPPSCKSIWSRLGLARRESRVGVAALLSLGILISFWTTNKLRHPVTKPSPTRPGTRLEADTRDLGAEAVKRPGPAARASAVEKQPGPKPAEPSHIPPVAAEIPQPDEPAETVVPAIPVAEVEKPAEARPGPVDSTPVAARPGERLPAEPDPAAVPPLPPGIDVVAPSPPAAPAEPVPPVPAPVASPPPGPASEPPLVGEPSGPAPTPGPAPTVAKAVPPAPATAPKPAPPRPPVERPQPVGDPPATSRLGTLPTAAVASGGPAQAVRSTPAAPVANVEPTPPPATTRPREPTPKAIPSFAPAPAPPPPATAAAGNRVPLPNAGKAPLDLERPIGPEPPRRVLVPASPRSTIGAAPAPAPAPTPAPEPFATHVVQSGENFWTISRLYYGKGRYYKALWKANQDRVPAPDQLAVGTTLRIPPPEGLDRALIEPAGHDLPPALAAGGRTATPVRRDAQTTLTGKRGDSLVMLPASRDHPPAADSVPLEPEKPRPFHVVRPYETLRSIARDRLGDARRADEILELNRDVIEDADHITRGTRLRLPPDAERVRR